MNIVTPVPTNIVFTTGNVNTEAARRDNVQRETVPQTAELENSAAHSGLGSESDKVKTPGRAPQPLTYDKTGNAQFQGQDPRINGQSQGNKDNAEDPSAGREEAESRQQQQQEAADQRKIEDLKARDQEVRTHEQAHAARGGEYAGAPSYEYETGPDGKRYATSGEVSIDISKEDTPEETLLKMQQVKAAALAPAEPSPQDLRVASEANQRAAEARSEIAQDNQDQLKSTQARRSGETTAVEERVPDLDDIVKDSDSGAPTRSLHEDPVAEAIGLESDGKEFNREQAARDATISQRVSVIEGFYANVSTPRATGVQLSA